MAELAPCGMLEEEIVSSLAHLLWRRRNLATFRKAQAARAFADRLLQRKVTEMLLPEPDRVAEATALAEEQARQQLGEAYQLVEMDRAATFDGLADELATQERLDAMIDRCMKRLMVVRGFKSLAPNPATARVVSSSAAA